MIYYQIVSNFLLTRQREGENKRAGKNRKRPENCVVNCVVKKHRKAKTLENKGFSDR